MIVAIRKDSCGYIKCTCDSILTKEHKEIVNTFSMLMGEGEELTLYDFVQRIINSNSINKGTKVKGMINSIMYEYNGNKNYL